MASPAQYENRCGWWRYRAECLGARRGDNSRSSQDCKENCLPSRGDGWRNLPAVMRRCCSAGFFMSLLQSFQEAENKASSLRLFGDSRKNESAGYKSHPVAKLNADRQAEGRPAAKALCLQRARLSQLVSFGAVQLRAN